MKITWGMVMGVAAGLMVGVAGYGKEMAQPAKKKMNIVFAIDVSGSMEHIIAATQKKVWAIVNDMMKAKPIPDIKIGLIAYRGEQENCYGHQGFKVWDLSDNLDKVYEHLMELKTDGGHQECVGRAIHEAARSMTWDEGKGVLKVLFVLGNESANQDTNQAKFGYKVTAPQAIADGIVINTVFCGRESGADQGWEEIARLTDGVFTTIGLEGHVVSIPTPMDGPLSQLNEKLNKTYVAFGVKAPGGVAGQMNMDAAAGRQGGYVAAERAIAKSSAAYRSAEWDLVDAQKDDSIDLKTMEAEALPAEMRTMKPEERKAYVDQKSKERDAVQKEIQTLAKEREAFIQKELAKQHGKGDAFDQVIQRALRLQAEKKGFGF